MKIHYTIIILVLLSATSQAAVLNGTQRVKMIHGQQAGSGKLLCKCPFDNSGGCETPDEIVRIASVARQLAQRSKCVAQGSMRFRREMADKAQKINKELCELTEEIKKMAYDVAKLAKCYSSKQDNDCTVSEMPNPCRCQCPLTNEE